MQNPRDTILTENEHDIVMRLLRKENASQIARETKRSVHTVRTTIRGIYSKLGVHSVVELSDALACGELVIHCKETKERAFGLSSSLLVLERESVRRSKSTIWPVKLHRDEIAALLNAGYAYSLLATTESNLSTLIERVEHLVADAEAQRPRIAIAIASVLGLQDHANGVMREPSQIDALAAVCADTPFPLKQGSRSELLDEFRTSYAAGSLARPHRRTSPRE